MNQNRDGRQVVLWNQTHQMQQTERYEMNALDESDMQRETQQIQEKEQLIQEKEQLIQQKEQLIQEKQQLMQARHDVENKHGQQHRQQVQNKYRQLAHQAQMQSHRTPQQTQQMQIMQQMPQIQQTQQMQSHQNSHLQMQQTHQMQQMQPCPPTQQLQTRTHQMQTQQAAPTQMHTHQNDMQAYAYSNRTAANETHINESKESSTEHVDREECEQYQSLWLNLAFLDKFALDCYLIERMVQLVDTLMQKRTGRNGTHITELIGIGTCARDFSMWLLDYVACKARIDINSRTWKNLQLYSKRKWIESIFKRNVDLKHAFDLVDFIVITGNQLAHPSRYEKKRSNQQKIRDLWSRLKNTLTSADPMIQNINFVQMFDRNELQNEQTALLIRQCVCALVDFLSALVPRFEGMVDV